jgi:hypothetical protein
MKGEISGGRVERRVLVFVAVSRQLITVVVHGCLAAENTAIGAFSRYGHSLQTPEHPADEMVVPQGRGAACLGAETTLFRVRFVLCAV